MDMEAKTKALRDELEAMGQEESRTRGRVQLLKQMIEEKKRRSSNLEALKLEEAALLELLK